MLMSVEQITQEITVWKIGAISLDTSVFDGQQRNLERGLLKRLQQFNGSDVKLILSDVVVKEVEAHLRKDAWEAQSSVKKALKLAGPSWQVSEEQAKLVETTLYGAETPESIAKSRLDNYMVVTSAIVANAEDHVAVGDLVGRYFASRPPFADKETKKHEFPDALAVLTLESWAEKEDVKILVVTKDGDWKAYCKDSLRLVAIDDLSIALGCFQREAASFNCLLLSQEYIAGDPLNISNAVLDAINKQEWKIEFIPEADSQFNFDVEDVESKFELVCIENVDDGQFFEPVEYGDDFLVALLSVAISAEVTCHFSFEKWDGIDKEYMSMGSGSSTVTEDLSIEALVTFRGRMPNKVKIEEIEVLAKREHISFGEVEPDWMSDPDNYGD